MTINMAIESFSVDIETTTAFHANLHLCISFTIADKTAVIFAPVDAIKLMWIEVVDNNKGFSLIDEEVKNTLPPARDFREKLSLI